MTVDIPYIFAYKDEMTPRLYLSILHLYCVLYSTVRSVGRTMQFEI